MTNDRPHNEDGLLRAELQGWMRAVECAGQVSLPLSNDALLRSIVEAAARIFQAAAASILLVNEAEEALEFKVSTGSADKDLAGMRIPLDQGIAGYVVMTGQPIAVSDVARDARFNWDFAQSTGYIPRSILAMPLVSGERVLGVMEVLDKIDAPAFGIQDMELLGIFARQAALAIELSQRLEQLGETMVDGLKQLALQTQAGEMAALIEALSETSSAARQTELRQVATLLNEFSRLGEAERETALKVLSAFADYGRARRRTIRGGSLR